jgi:small conductance mechanosensitive channel
MSVNQIIQQILPVIGNIGLQIVGAFIFWVVGQKLIEFAARLVKRGMRNTTIDPTLITYLINILTVTLRVVLIVAILGYFGIQTTSFAALLAAAGVAIGAAWGGLLANFAAGAFLIIFRPFKVGDFITAAGVTGDVQEIGLFTTSINTLDNVLTIVGNNKIFADNIQNYSVNSYRRVELLAQIDHSVNPIEAINLLKGKISQIPNVLSNPAPDVEILSFNASGPLLAVRPYCHNDNYWQVYFDTNKAIHETFGQAGYPVPQPQYVVNGQMKNGNGNGSVVASTSMAN